MEFCRKQIDFCGFSLQLVLHVSKYGLVFADYFLLLDVLLFLFLQLYLQIFQFLLHLLIDILIS